jgi:hypothetical protein
MDETKTVTADIELAYLEAVRRCGEALRFLHQPNGQVKLHLLKFSVPFYTLFQHTTHIPAVATMLQGSNGNPEELEKWFFSQEYSRQSLKRGIQLFSWYQKILLESRVIKIENQ